MTRTILAWGGFIHERPDTIENIEPQYPDGGAKVHAIFKTKKAPELRYEDVRQVKITFED